MTRHQALRKMGCGWFTATAIDMLNRLAGTHDGKIRFMHITIEYDIKEQGDTEMTTKQPEALLMAEVLKADGWPSVAAKLQQLHFENQGQAERIQDIYKQLNDTEKEVDDLRLLLLQALEALTYWLEHGETPGAHDMIQRTHDALQERLIPLGVGKGVGKREHITDGSPCWCNPETTYTDPDTGVSVIVHKEPQ